MTLETLQADLAALLDRPGEWSQRERDTRAALEARIAQLQADANAVARAEAAVADVDRRISELTTWRDFLTSARDRMLLELAATGQGRLERHRAADLNVSIRSIERSLTALDGASAYSLRNTRLGTLMVDAGYSENTSMEQLRVYGWLPWRGSLPDVAKEMALLEKERGAATFALTIARRDYEAG